MVDYALVLSIKYAKDNWALNGDAYSGLEWFSETSKPTEKELRDAWPEIESRLFREQAEKSRHTAYSAPNGSDAIFMKYQRGEATKQEWLDAVEEIKNRYPVGD